MKDSLYLVVFTLNGLAPLFVFSESQSGCANKYSWRNGVWETRVICPPNRPPVTNRQPSSEIPSSQSRSGGYNYSTQQNTTRTEPLNPRNSESRVLNETTVLPAFQPLQVNYTAIHPPFVSPNRLFKIAVFIQPTRNPSRRYNVSATLTSSSDTFSSPEKTLEPGDGRIEIEVGNVTDQIYNLTLTIRHRNKRTIEKVKAVEVDPNYLILIQSDKPVYKPGDKVQFRALLLDRFSRPVEGAVNVKIFDAENNLIRFSKNVASKRKGYFRDDFQLSHEPNLGEWKIEVETTMPGQNPRGSFIAQKKSISFQVTKYTLPKFDVQLELPTFKIYTDVEQHPIRINVTARYVHGKAVKGHCKVDVRQVQFTCEGQIEYHIATAQFPINGSASEDIDAKSIEVNNFPKDGAELKFRVSVTEIATGIVMEEEKSMKLHYYSYKILPVSRLSYHRHGLPFLIDFHIVDQNNKRDTTVNETVSVTHDFGGEKRTDTQTIDQGILRLNYTLSGDASSERFMQFTYRDITYRYTTPERVDSRNRILQSENSLSIEMTQPSDFKVSSGSDITMRVRFTTVPETINFVLANTDEILSAGFTKNNITSPMNLRVRVPEGIEGDATLFVFTYIDGKYVGDSIPLKISQSTRQNQPSVTISKEKLQPGENVTITIHSSPGSLIALRGIDRSLLLLSTDNDINNQVLEEETNHALTNQANMQFTDLKRINMVTDSNFGEEESPSKIAHIVPSTSEICFEPRGDGEDPDYDSSEIILPAFVRQRNYFPEIWFWDDFEIESPSNRRYDGTSKISFVKSVPDTMTSWVITGYVLNARGIEFLPSAQITTAKEFFITLDLPYSIAQGEELLLNVLIHNYLEPPQAVTALVTINNPRRYGANQDFQISMVQEADAHGIECAPNSVTPAKFRVKPSKFGDLALNVEANVGIAGDALLKHLRVTPRGERRTIKKLVDLKANPNDTVWERLGIDFPIHGRIKGSDSVKVSIVSDIMGNVALDNLENLIKLPVGCGEQNMLSFVADLAILNYLDATRQLSEEIRKKAAGYLELGYQRQLTFKHEDGSFSAFGKHDANGSTWLTAFVIRHFLRAQKYIAIDDAVIAKGVEFLKTQQSPEGMFTESGRVFDLTVQEGLGSNGAALAAFCLLTFIEAKNNAHAVDSHIAAGQRFLRSQFEVIKNAKQPDVYSLVLLTHALSEQNPTDLALEDKYLPMMKTFASMPDGATKFWGIRGEAGQVSSAHPALAIEMSSYALLIFLRMNDTNSALPIANWLVKQQNENGGFVSTRDTSVALTALAKYAELTRSDNLDMQVNIFALNTDIPTPSVTVVSRGLNVTTEYSKLLQEFRLPEERNLILFQLSGSGALRAYVTWMYYVEQQIPTNSNSFFINAIPKPTNNAKNFDLTVCAQNLLAEKSNMAVMEVNLPSGYTFDDARNFEHAASNGVFKRHDVTNQGTKIQMYFDFILQSQETCAVVFVKRNFSVSNASEGFVRVFDYYEPTRTAKSAFALPRSSSL